MQPGIRPATPADAPTLVHFVLEEAREAEGLSLDRSTVEDGVSNALGGAVSRYWVVVDATDERIIASASVYAEWSDWNNADYWWLQSFYVVPSQRGRGLAQRLLRYIEDEAVAAGVIELRLYVHSANHRAMAAYLNSGFRDTPYRLLSRKLPSRPT